MAEAGSEEKTEAPSQKKRDDARKEGQVAFSKELSSVALLGSFLLLVYFSGGIMLKSFVDTFKYSFQNLEFSEFTVPLLEDLFDQFFRNSSVTVIPFLAVALIIGILASAGQVGIQFTLKPLQPSFSKISPIKGLGRIFSKQSLGELFKSVFKMGVMIYIGYFTFVDNLDSINNLTAVDPKLLMETSAIIIGEFVLRLFFALLIMSIFDYMFQIWDLEQKLKMSKQELKDEFKQTEGDPALKAKIRSIQQQMSQARMMQEVPEADVVVSNPTHFAVAMKYDRESMHAPKVIAKGVDYIALRMMEIAKENDVSVYQNPTVARALYFQVEIGDDIPEEFYKAVAEILAFVYKTKRKQRKK